MSAFREALLALGHGEWIVDSFSPSGVVRLRRVNHERGADPPSVITSSKDLIPLKAAA
jgi:hypothetical protein